MNSVVLRQVASVVLLHAASERRARSYASCSRGVRQIQPSTRAHSLQNTASSHQQVKTTALHSVSSCTITFSRGTHSSERRLFVVSEYSRTKAHKLA